MRELFLISKRISQILHSPIEEIHQSVDDVVSRLHVLVVGPGLGRDDHMQACAREAISIAKKRDIGLVIDADGLWFINNNIDAIKGYKKAILTPNVMEMKRLCEKLVSNVCQFSMSSHF